MTDTHIWMELPETGGKAQFAVEAAEDWKARGWQPCEPAEETSTLRDPEPDPEPEPAPEPVTKPAAKPAPKTEEK